MHALLVVAAALVGATAGVLGSFVHALEVGWVPVGLVVGLVWLYLEVLRLLSYLQGGGRR